MLKTPPNTGLAEAVWSVAVSGPLDSRSAATTHTAFDDDVPTMDSVVRRVVGRDNIISYGTTKHAAVLASAAGEVLRRPLAPLTDVARFPATWVRQRTVRKRRPGPRGGEDFPREARPWR